MPTIKMKLEQNGPLLVALLAIFTTSMVADGIVPALPLLQRELHASTDSMGWFYTAPMLSAVVTLPLIGKLAEVFSRQRILLAILVVVCLGMLLSALAEHAPLLIFGQMLSGLSLSLFPLSVGLIRDSCSANRIGPANALVGSLGAVAPMIGLLACGPIVEHFSLRWLFWGPCLMLLVSVIFMLMLPRRDVGKQREHIPVDWTGALFLSAALGSGLLAISRISESVWSDPVQIALFLGALFCGAVWIWHEKRVTQPLIALSLFSNRLVLACGLCMLVAGYLIVSVSVAIPLFAELGSEQGGLGASVAQVSGYFLAMSLAGMAVTPFIDRVEQRIGSRRLVMLAMLVLAATTAMTILLPSTTMSVTLAMAVIGAAFTAVLVESMNVIAANFTVDEVTEISSLSWVMKSIGATLGSQITACIIALGAGADMEMAQAAAVFHSLAVAALIGVAGIAAALLMPRQRQPLGS